jgi:hypothetical protein
MKVFKAGGVENPRGVSYCENYLKLILTAVDRYGMIPESTNFFPLF